MSVPVTQGGEQDFRTTSVQEGRKSMTEEPLFLIAQLERTTSACHNKPCGQDFPSDTTPRDVGFSPQRIQFPPGETKGERSLFFPNIFELFNATNLKILIANELQGCSSAHIKNPKAEALAALQMTGGDFFLTKHRANEHTANAYCVNYSAAPCSNPDGSSNKLWQIQIETALYTVSLYLHSAGFAARACEDCAVRLGYCLNHLTLCY